MKKQLRVDGGDDVTTSNDEVKPLEETKPEANIPYFDEDEDQAML